MPSNCPYELAKDHYRSNYRGHSGGCSGKSMAEETIPRGAKWVCCYDYLRIGKNQIPRLIDITDE